MKIRNYQNTLVRWARSQIGKDWTWGETDCASLAIASVRLIYPTTPEMPVWEDRETAESTLAQYGSIAEWMRSLGFSKVLLSHASAGDIFTTPDSPMTCCIYLGDGLALSPPIYKPPEINQIDPLSDYWQAWRLPD